MTFDTRAATCIESMRLICKKWVMGLADFVRAGNRIHVRDHSRAIGADSRGAASSAHFVSVVAHFLDLSGGLRHRDGGARGGSDETGGSCGRGDSLQGRHGER